MAGYGMYSGVGGVDDQQPSQGGNIQTLQDSQVNVPQYSGPSSSQVGGGVGGGQQVGSGIVPMGQSTMNSGFYGQGGLSKAQYYLPQNADPALLSSKMDPFQMSAQLAGGTTIRQQDIAALRAASDNSMNPYYSGIAQYGINANPYAQQFQNSGFAPQQAGGFFQQMSQRGPMAGVNYNIDPRFGLRGSIGDLNFDVMQYDRNWNSPAAYNAWNPYLGGQNWQTASSVGQGVGSIIENGGPRDYQFQQGVSSTYRPAVQNEAYMGNGLYFVG